ncbi:MAG: hypothetical protein M3069_25910 [Chloroflexota bacterium]|nr:hypothetical protein [Chloroflexota bacterium]
MSDAHPGPDELTAYADGEASADVVAHVGNCGTCTEQAAGDFRTTRQLRKSLYRFDCPSAHTLGEYQLDLLDVAEHTSVAAHATRCEDCRAELQMLRTFMAAPIPVPLSVGERLRRVVASSFTPGPGVAYGGVRGAGQTSTRVFQAGDVTLSVGAGLTRGTLIGLAVVAAAPPEALAGREARLVSGAGASTSALLDDLGNFEFDDIPVGSYVLEVELADRVIVVEELHVD